MAIMRSYICPDCNGKFDFLHHPSDEPPPPHCPLCGSDVSGKKKKKQRLKRAVTAPAIKTVVSKSADGVYRQMENASKSRAEQAAEMLGVDSRTLSSMKMTNMKDNMREGDMSYVPSSATKITGASTDIVNPGTGKPLGAGFGQPTAIPSLPGAPVQEMRNAMSSTFLNHQNRVQATVAAGKTK